ncbi:MAG: protein-glutamine gamma-glutamyltransferase [Porticoccaceae bacterium]|nr:MAG: protein-glutamine gamma-glutamyltransferase [Porticoccaceae bacterium]
MAEAVPRPAAFWLAAAATVAVAPFARHLPLWAVLVAPLAAGFHLALFRRGRAAGGRWLPALALGACLAALALEFPRWRALEPMASLLLAAFGLKFLELRSTRDAAALVLLGFFVAAVLPLFAQGPAVGLYLLAVALLLVASLAALQLGGGGGRGVPLRLAARLLVSALPLALVLFVALPRVGAFWSVPSPAAVTGMGDELVLGEVAELSRSAQVAFRVRFEGPPPPPAERYWRGLVLSRFDGRSWREVSWGHGEGVVAWAGQEPSWWRRDLVLAGPPRVYEVFLEPGGGRHLYALLGSRMLTPGTGMTRLQTAVALPSPAGRFRYRAEYRSVVAFEAGGLPDVRRRIELALPAQGNPRSRALAARWRAEAGSPEAFLERILEHFRRHFAYTLRPPPLPPEDAVDAFLFETRRGFCEHFAAALAFMLRAGGVPARVVIGFQGGELHPTEGYLTVRRYDAHAWTEAWLAGRGWVRVDPTAVVAPDRLTLGLLGLLGAEQVLAEEPVALERLRHLPGIERLRWALDTLDYAWGRWVLGYRGVQGELLGRLFGALPPRWLLLPALAALLFALLLAAALALPLARARAHPADRLFERFCRRLARVGLRRVKGETARAFCRRAAAQLPELAAAIAAVDRHYEAARYRGAEASLAALHRAVVRVRPGGPFLQKRLRPANLERKKGLD